MIKEVVGDFIDLFVVDLFKLMKAEDQGVCFIKYLATGGHCCGVPSTQSRNEQVQRE